MKIRITYLKAPWPQGATVGDVLEVAEITPAFVGKCILVGDDEEVTVKTESAEIVANVVPPADPVGEDEDDAEAKAAAAALAEAEAQAQEEAQALGKRAALEAEATALGVSFRSNLSDDKLAERIAEAKAAAEGKAE